MNKKIYFSYNDTNMTHPFIKFVLIGYMFGWYGIVLVLSSADSKEPLVKPTNKQWIGLTFTFLIACLVWLQNVFVFQGDAEKQG